MKILLDNGHGQDTPGKRSPDGFFREYAYTRFIASQMTETTCREAKTIHRLLEFKPPEGYQRNDENPLEGDVLIVDEASMVDILLMNALVKALPDSMRLILV